MYKSQDMTSHYREDDKHPYVVYGFIWLNLKTRTRRDPKQDSLVFHRSTWASVVFPVILHYFWVENKNTIASKVVIWCSPGICTWSHLHPNSQCCFQCSNFTGNRRWGRTERLTRFEGGRRHHDAVPISSSTSLLTNLEYHLSWEELYHHIPSAHWSSGWIMWS